ncbi:hypothetical protein N658DRAFT_143212 [Parathielavia hyrcaniae]|uniref:Uncharacterized protein n=1 Tax=Parathielavia hyrcaniae TaxID=113614 RepID=A0AAN6PY64_9PEZI|nr:hypothetical protein N658DRAFT_143212 [Parathielavia hyrcaniae]
MSNSFVNQQFQPSQGLQPAIPFQSRTPRRARVETSIHPPQLPPARPPQSTPAHQQPQQLQNQQEELDQQFRQAEQAYLAAYNPNVKALQPVYHTIDPTRTTLRVESPYTPNQWRQPEPGNGLRFDQAQPGDTSQQHVNPQEPGDNQDESMHEDDSGADEEGDDNTNEAEGGAGPSHDAKEIAPLVQEVKPLHYPAVRPTLLLGPYETRDEAQKAAVEYGIAQGYMLIQTGCARAKTCWEGYGTERPLVRVDLMCDRSGSCKNMGTGKRKRPTHKIGCPARIKIVRRKRDGCKWFIDPRCELHNHDLNVANMDSIASYRRFRRMQAGGGRVETRKERSERRKRGTFGELQPALVPPPTFHNAGPQPTSEPTGPVHMAAYKGQVKILEILLNRGGDIDVHDMTGRTALHYAILGGRTDTLKLLIEKGANVSRCDSKSLSPLRLAVEKGMEDAVVALIEKGADPNK